MTSAAPHCSKSSPTPTAACYASLRVDLDERLEGMLDVFSGDGT